MERLSENEFVVDPGWASGDVGAMLGRKDGRVLVVGHAVDQFVERYPSLAQRSADVPMAILREIRGASVLRSRQGDFEFRVDILGSGGSVLRLVEDHRNKIYVVTALDWQHGELRGAGRG